MKYRFSIALLFFVLSVALFSQSVSELYTEANQAFKDSNFDKAEELISKALELKSDNAGLWNFRGAIRSAGNNHPKALEDYSIAIEINSDNDKYYYNRGVSYERLGKLENAKADFKKAVTINNNNWTAISGLGNIELEYNRFESAIEYFKESINLNPEAFNPVNNLAYAYNQVGSYDLAINCASKAIGLDNTQASAFNHRAFAYFKKGKNSLALNEVNKAIEIDPEYSKTYYTKGLIFEVQNKLTDALKEFEMALELTPTFQAFYQQPYLASKKLEKKFLSQQPPMINIMDPSVISGRGFKELSDILFQTQMDEIVIQGRVISGLDVSLATLQGEAFEIDGDGFFTQSVKLNEGRNSIIVKARNNAGESSLTFIVEKRSTELNEKTIKIPDGKNYAICIGMSNYDHPSVSDLAKPIQDAELLGSVINTYYNFDKVFILKDPSREKIFSFFDKLSLGIRPTDNLLIFYAGHGHWDKRLKRGYWLLKDASPGNRATWFSNSDLKDYIGAINTRHTLLITDACFSGSIFETKGNFEEKNIDSSEKYIATSRNAMTSGSLRPVPDESVFLKMLAKKLYVNQNKYLDTSTLFDSFEEIVKSNTKNTPLYGEIKDAGGEGGEFVFVKK